jgi:hypothetical protein
VQDIKYKERYKMRKNQQIKKLASLEKQYKELVEKDPHDPELVALREKIQTFKKRLGQ